MSEGPLVSIIMSVHNGESSLKKSLESLIIQTYKNIEILIMDDGSSDNSFQILEELSKDKELSINDFSIDPQIMDKLEKFASIKHILNKIENDEFKIIDLLEEVVRDIKNNELEIRIEELESKFSKDLNEHTFNEIRELKKLQKTN